MNKALARMVYLVSQYIEVMDGETGEIIDSYSEAEYYPSYSEACKRADELHQLIGEIVCEWDNVCGILKKVYCDDVPRGIQQY